MSSLCWERSSCSKKGPPSTWSWLEKQGQDCLQCQGWKWTCRGADQRFSGILYLDCLLSGLWQKKKKRRLWIPFVLPFYVAQRKSKAKKNALWSRSIWKNKQTPLQWETPASEQNFRKAALIANVPEEGTPRAHGRILPFLYAIHQILFLTISILFKLHEQRCLEHPLNNKKVHAYCNYE